MNNIEQNMTRNLETADKVAKLTLASATIVLYFLRLIQGPFAEALLLLSVTVLGIYLIKLVVHSQGD